jgi:hypothetical protein
MKIVIAAFLVAAVGIPTAASAQEVSGNSSWTAWLGCWELVQDDTRAVIASVLATGNASARPSAARPTDMRVCVTQDASNAGVKMTTFAAGQVVLEQTIVADGRQQPANETGCTGSQRAEWSDNRRQLFMHAEIQCKDQPRRSISGLTLIADGPAWLDIQALGVNGNYLLRVRRYQRAADQTSLSPADAARSDAEAHRIAATPLTIDDVIQASSNVVSRAVEAMIIETHATFDLDSRALLRLQKAGVAGAVTDLMVALSFPARFVVERQVAGGFSSSFSSPFSAQYESYWYPAYVPYAPLGLYSPYYYSFYGYSYSPYAYSPFAYGYWYDPYLGLASVGIARSEGGAAANSGAETGAGRAIAGRGYTRVRPRGDGGGATPTGQETSSSSGESSTRSARSGTRGSSTGGTVSTGGYSRGGSDNSAGGSSGSGSSSDGSGSSGSSTGGSGRTAQPR